MKELSQVNLPSFLSKNRNKETIEDYIEAEQAKLQECSDLGEEFKAETEARELLKVSVHQTLIDFKILGLIPEYDLSKLDEAIARLRQMGEWQ